MRLNQAGAQIIKDSEGYHRRLPDGGCTAYQCPAGVWTIGWGNTEGVKPGLVWSKEKAEAEFSSRMAYYEDSVTRLVTVPINENEYSALVSLTYNIGPGSADTPGRGLMHSNVLRNLNNGDRAAAARCFSQYTRFYNRRTGQREIAPGLVTRRARERALFLTPVEAPAEPNIPQEVEGTPEPSVANSRKQIISAGMLTMFGGGSIANVASQGAEQLGTASTVLSTVRGFASEHGLTILLLTCLAGLLATLLWQHFAQQDHTTGRYEQSGGEA